MTTVNNCNQQICLFASLHKWSTELLGTRERGWDGEREGEYRHREKKRIDMNEWMTGRHTLNVSVSPIDWWQAKSVLLVAATSIAIILILILIESKWLDIGAKINKSRIIGKSWLPLPTLHLLNCRVLAPCLCAWAYLCLDSVQWAADWNEQSIERGSNGYCGSDANEPHQMTSIERNAHFRCCNETAKSSSINGATCHELALLIMFPSSAIQT